MWPCPRRPTRDHNFTRYRIIILHDYTASEREPRRVRAHIIIFYPFLFFTTTDKIISLIRKTRIQTHTHKHEHIDTHRNTHKHTKRSFDTYSYAYVQRTHSHAYATLTHRSHTRTLLYPTVRSCIVVRRFVVVVVAAAAADSHTHLLRLRAITSTRVGAWWCARVTLSGVRELFSFLSSSST